MIGMSMAMQAPRQASLDAQVQGILKRYDPLAHQWDFTLGQAEINARRNQLLWTEDFNNPAWSKSNCAVTSNNNLAPDGSFTATLITASGSSVCIQAFNAKASQLVYTIYAAKSTGATKAATFLVRNATTATNLLAVNIDYDTGVVLANPNTSSEAANNGFWKITIKVNAGFIPGDLMYVYVGFAGVNIAGDAAYFWHPQVDFGAVATAYQKITDWNAEFLALFPRHHLYQDAGGSIPVTGVEQPIGLVLDEPTGTVTLDQELVTNGDNEAGLFTFGTPTLGGITLSRVTNLEGRVAAARAVSNNSTSVAHRVTTTTLPMLAGKTYAISVDVYIPAGGVSNCRFFDNTDGSFFASSMTAVGQWVTLTAKRRKSTNWDLGIGNNAVDTITSGVDAFYIDNLSIREVIGAHASQGTSTKRPTLSARYNGLTYTEVFSNAIWTKYFAPTPTANAIAAPDGSMTGWRLVADAALNQHRIDQPSNLPSGSQTFWVIAKQDVAKFIALRIGLNLATFNLETGTLSDATGGIVSSITPEGGGWYKCSMTDPAAAAAAICRINIGDPAAVTGGVDTFTGNGVNGVYLWRTSVIASSAVPLNLPSYQRVSSSTLYDIVGFPTYTKFDGIDDALVTLGIDFSGTSGVTVVTGFTKLSDATVGLVYEFGTDTTAVNGSFYLASPANAATANYGVATRGTTTVTATTASSYPSPRSGVLTHIASIAKPSLSLAVNGTSVASSTSTQGTGNYANQPLYIGARNGTTLPFNGNISTITMLGATNTDPLYDNTVVLLPMSASLGLATDIRGNTFTVQGSAFASPTPALFNDTCLDTSIAGSALACSNASLFHFPGDFSVQCWFYNGEGHGLVYGIGGVDQLTWQSQSVWVSNDQVIFTASSNNTSANIANNLPCGTANRSAWNFLEVARTGAVYKIFLNGVLERTINVNLAPYYSVYGLAIGNYPKYSWNNFPTQFHPMPISEFRISNIARNTDAYPPPTAAFPRYGNQPTATELLTLEAYANNKMRKVY